MANQHYSTGDPIIYTTGSKDDARSILNDGGTRNNILDTFLAMRGEGFDRDQMFAYLQLYLQYLLGEQNYDRSKASNQVAQLMSTGMSRSAALSALQSGSNSQTTITPQGSTAEQNANAQYSNILNTVQTAGNLAMQIASLATMPFDIKAKRLTNNMLQNQSNMLEQQYQGMQDAAAFMQASANLGTSGVDVSQMSLSDQIGYFQSMQSKMPDAADFNLPAHEYSVSPSFKRSLSNPFFWSALQDSYQRQNQSDASMYDAARAEQEVSRLRAATDLTEKQRDVEVTRNKIMSSEAFIAETTQQARQDLELMRLICERNNYEFDGERAKAFLSRLESFNSLDFLTLDYQIQRITRMKDPNLMKREFDALAASLDYQVGSYLYNSSLTSIKNGALNSMFVTDDSGNSVASPELYNWAKIALQYNELGYDTYRQLNQGTWRNIFSGVTAAGVAAFTGFKIWQGFNALKPAATAVMQSGSPSLPFNGLAPLIVPATTQYMFNGGSPIDPFGNSTGMQ